MGYAVDVLGGEECGGGVVSDCGFSVSYFFPTLSLIFLGVGKRRAKSQGVYGFPLGEKC